LSYLLPWSHFPQPSSPPSCYSPSSPHTLLVEPFTWSLLHLFSIEVADETAWVSLLLSIS
jgi:hypothetical protein